MMAMRLRTLLVLASVAAFAFALSQPPSPIATRQGALQEQRTSQVEELSLPTQTNQRPAVQTNQEQQAASNSNLLDWLPQLIVGLLTMLVGFLQWKVMQGQKEVSEKQSDIAERQNTIINTQTTHMEAGLVETRKAAEAAKTSADTARLAERAWIAARNFEATPNLLDVGANIKIKFAVHNSGRTPAFIREILHYCDVGAELPPRFPWPDLVLGESRQLVMPGHPAYRYFDRTKTVTRDELVALTAGAQFVFVWGRITYEDAFGMLHHTWFGMRSDPAISKFTHIDSKHYNDAD
jgi:hypothetical protein